MLSLAITFGYSAFEFCRTVEMRLGTKVPEVPSLVFALGW